MSATAPAEDDDRGAEGPYTWEDFVALDDEDRRELIDGELVEVEVPTDAHEAAVIALGAMLWNWARVDRRARVLASGYKIKIADDRGVMPDVQLYRTENPTPRQEAGLVEGHPDLVVEVISPSSRRIDRLKKMNWYAEKGVPEYWLVDPVDRSIERLVLHEGFYRFEQIAMDKQTFRPASFEGLEIPLADLWEDSEAPPKDS